MSKKTEIPTSAVAIDSGPVDWEIVQQDATGGASLKLRGRWSTLIKRKRPDVRVRVVPEGRFSPVTSTHDWTRARTSIDRQTRGTWAGRHGTWALTFENVPAGGLYRIETSVGSIEEGNEWRRAGDCIHFVGVGDLWLIAGQSNAEGYGRDEVDDPSELGVHHLTEDGWTLAAHGRFHNPWLTFAKRLKQELGYPIGLVPTAVGGSAVSEWDPGQRGGLFVNMKQRLESAGAGLKGCVWYQGESDTEEEAYPHYKTRFSRFVKGLRRVVKQPKLPVITMQLNRVLGAREDGDGWDAMREIQRQLSHELDNVFVFPVFEAGLCDGIHTASLGNILIAQRAVATALGGVYGRSIHYRHPECVVARKRSGRRLELRFDHVIERLDYELAIAHGFPFAIKDDQGDIPVSGYQIVRKDVIRIHLSRRICGDATVTGAPGNCPPQIIPRDINGYRGMLGFTMPVSDAS